MTVSAKVRASLPASQMGLPAQGKYPMPDASHAANAKARATQQVTAGNLQPAQKQVIDRKADAVMGKHNPDDKLPRHAMHTRGRNRGL